SGRSSYKNFTGLLKAFSETGLYRSFDLLVLGGGPLSQEEMDLMAQLGLTDSIISIPIATDGLLAEAYAAAKLLVYPSFWEGFGLPPLEAMAAGCPVLASDKGPIREVSRDGPLYFDPEDQDSFNLALLRAVDDDELCKQAIERGRQ